MKTAIIYVLSNWATINRSDSLQAQMKSKDMKYVGGGNVPFGKHEVPSLFGSQKTILFLSSSTTTSTTAVFYSVTTTVRHGERTEDGRKTEKKEWTRSFMINKSQNGKRKKKEKTKPRKPEQPHRDVWVLEETPSLWLLLPRLQYELGYIPKKVPLTVVARARLHNVTRLTNQKDGKI